MSPGISETVSENRRRGRPPLINPATLAEMRRDPLCRGRSTRQLYNYLYQGRAQRLLAQPTYQPWARWLIDYDGVRQNRKGSIKPTILAELGRIEDDADLVAVAEVICARQPTAHEAVQMVRYARRGHKPQGTADNLANRVIAVLNDYRRHHAGVDRVLMLDALARVEDAVWALNERPPERP